MSRELLDRVRRLCLALPDTEERISHGAPTFFTRGKGGMKVFVMYADNHHGDGRTAVWLPVPDGLQAGLITADPSRYFHPPYVGVRGWVGIVLTEIDPATLEHHVITARELVAGPAKRRGV
jgi:hypothetical protein